VKRRRTRLFLSETEKKRSPPSTNHPSRGGKKRKKGPARRSKGSPIKEEVRKGKTYLTKGENGRSAAGKGRREKKIVHRNPGDDRNSYQKQKNEKDVVHPRSARGTKGDSGIDCWAEIAEREKKLLGQKGITHIGMGHLSFQRGTTERRRVKLKKKG